MIDSHARANASLATKMASPKRQRRKCRTSNMKEEILLEIKYYQQIIIVTERILLGIIEITRIFTQFSNFIYSIDLLEQIEILILIRHSVGVCLAYHSFVGLIQNVETNKEAQYVAR